MFFGSVDESCSLVEGMAMRLGKDIPAAIMKDPELQAAAFRAAVMRCMSCTEHGACQKLQAENNALETAPDYCRNRWT